MSIGEGDGALCQSLEVGSDDPGMMIERGDVIVQIIDRDEEHVGLVLCYHREAGGGENDEEKRAEFQSRSSGFAAYHIVCLVEMTSVDTPIFMMIWPRKSAAGPRMRRNLRFVSLPSALTRLAKAV